MPITRRELLAAAGVTSGLAVCGLARTRLVAQGPIPAAEVDALFDRSVVVDALSADEQWEEPAPIFAAFARSGISAIHTSLSNRNLNVALRDLAEWQARFDRWPDRLLKVVRGAQITEAKRSGRVGVLLGFQNATIVESDIRNLDPLYAAGTRCIQLTYNSRICSATAARSAPTRGCPISAWPSWSA